MSDLRQETIDTYNTSAKALSDYFKGIGSRVKDIVSALELAGNVKNPKILEIGCGDGRDAKEILKHTDDYIGFDISEGLIALARQYVPDGNFEIADAATYEYPDGLDIVFAFASLLHNDKAEVAHILEKVYASLNPNGIFYISLKYKPEYGQEIKEDKYGRRLFYFYTPEMISTLAGSGYETVKVGHKTIGNTDWFEIALRKT